MTDADASRVFGALADMSWLCAGSPRIRVLKPLARPVVGSEIWLRWDVLAILPVAMGLAVHAVDAPRTIEFTMVHGPFAHFDYTITVGDGANRSIDVEHHVRCELPWWFGGGTLDRAVAKTEVERLFSLAKEIRPHA